MHQALDAKNTSSVTYLTLTIDSKKRRVLNTRR